MFTINEPPKEFEPLNDRCRELVIQILENIQTPSETFKLRSGNSLYDLGEEKKFVYVLKEGTLAYVLNDRTLFYFQEGDIIGFEKELDIFTPHILSDFATVLERFPAQQFIDEVHASATLTALWQEFLGRYIAALYVVARSLFKDAQTVLPEVRNYSEGSVILEQGTIGDEVFTMADGSASVTSNDKKIGEIHTDQVFGLIGALTETPRAASVIAETDCLVLVMKKKDYLELMLSRPSVMQNILTDMAETLVQEGKQLAGAWLKL
jgi:CRP/FNR family cyclic AMP-dependent transcriptional regulator